jgi:hypothetical protein
MAFCTTCGAQVTGAYCNQCGAPVREQPAAGHAPNIPPPPPPPFPPVADPLARRRTSPLVWILVAVMGLFLIGAMGVAAVRFFVGRVAERAGIDSELWRSNPAAAVARMLAATDADLQVLDTDTSNGRVRLRNRRTGKEVVVNFDDVRRGRIRFSADADNGGSASVEIGGSSARLPSWLPEYPNSTAKPVFSVKGDSDQGTGEAGTFTFTTSDSPEKVLAFYQDKADELGMRVELRTSGSHGGGTLVGVDEDGGRSLTAIVSGASPTSVSVAYSRKR